MNPALAPRSEFLTEMGYRLHVAEEMARRDRTCRPLFQPLPQAWIGYTTPVSSQARVKICERCPDRDEALRQAKQAKHDVLMCVCGRCRYESMQRRMGEFTAST